MAKITKDCCEVCHEPANTQTVVFTASIRGERTQVPLVLCIRHALAHERLVHRRVSEALDSRLLVVRDETGGAHILRSSELS